MTTQSNLVCSLAALACFTSFSLVASGQPGTPSTPAAPTQAQAPTAAPAPTAPVAATPAQPAPAPAPAAAPIVVPPGYALVPVEGDAQTRYNVDYPQTQGALPPGMELPYEEGEPVPPGYRVVTQPRRGLVIAGSVVTGVLWGLSVTGAVSDDLNHKSGALFVPVLGPWIMLALGGAKDRPCNGDYYYSSSTTCGDQSGLRSMLVLDGLGQVAGAAMFTLGFALPKTRLVRKDVTLSMSPMPVGNFGYGLGAVGTF